MEKVSSVLDLFRTLTRCHLHVTLLHSSLDTPLGFSSLVRESFEARFTLPLFLAQLLEVSLVAQQKSRAARLGLGGLIEEAHEMLRFSTATWKWRELAVFGGRWATFQLMMAVEN